MPSGGIGLVRGWHRNSCPVNRNGTMDIVMDALGAFPKPGEVREVVVREAVSGGWCVGTVAGDHPDGTERLVIFIRHALPGERVMAAITQVTSRFARADAVEVLRAAPGRVRPPCPYAQPGGCGGCDWQHASPAAQREIKARVIAQQFRRIARLEVQAEVEPLAGDMGGLGWRTRMRFAVGRDGSAGLRRHRSHDIVAVRDCLIAHPLVAEVGVTRRRWPGARWVDVAVAPESGERTVIVTGGPRRGADRGFLTQHAAGRDWRVAAGGFWQVHPGAADTLASAVSGALRPEPGDRVLDLYCGAGLFAGVLAESVGPGGTVIGVEQDAAAVRDARHNLRPVPWARIHRADATRSSGPVAAARASIAVLDPPRTGAGPSLVAALCEQGHLRRIAYVSCDPATLARDVAEFGRRGWRMEHLRAFDAFPMTHHVECLAVLAPGAQV